jgi:hypothetical protein
MDFAKVKKVVFDYRSQGGILSFDFASLNGVPTFCIFHSLEGEGWTCVGSFSFVSTAKLIEEESKLYAATGLMMHDDHDTEEDEFFNDNLFEYEKMMDVISSWKNGAKLEEVWEEDDLEWRQEMEDLADQEEDYDFDEDEKEGRQFAKEMKEKKKVKNEEDDEDMCPPFEHSCEYYKCYKCTQ